MEETHALSDLKISEYHRNSPQAIAIHWINSIRTLVISKNTIRFLQIIWFRSRYLYGLSSMGIFCNISAYIDSYGHFIMPSNDMAHKSSLYRSFSMKSTAKVCVYTCVYLCVWVYTDIPKASDDLMLRSPSIVHHIRFCVRPGDSWRLHLVKGSI